MSEIQLIPLGTSPAWYNPGEACSGYLLQAGDYRILIDCGSGVISRYLELDGRPLDAIVISHVHADHVFDLVPLKYGIEIGGLHNWTPQLWLPPGARNRLATLVSAWDQPSTFFDKAFDVREYMPGQAFNIGGFSVSAIEVPHFIESFALRFDHASARFAYSADTAPMPELVDFVRGVDCFLCEATLRHGSDDPSGIRGHLSAEEAGDIAQRAGVHSLVLTHVPSAIGEEAAIAGARRCFTGPVELAQSGMSYSVDKRLAKVS
jgi:ribonuclease BN (tRNA processing enzyme)